MAISFLPGSKYLPKTSTYTTAIKFDQPFTDLGEHTVAGAIAFTADLTDAQPSYQTGVTLIADGVHVPDMSAFDRFGTDNYNNTAGARNQFVFYYLGGRACYVVAARNATGTGGGGGGGGDTTPPTVTSRVVEDATPNKLRINYNEALLGSSVPNLTDFILNEASPGSGFTGSITMGSNYVELTLSTPMAFGDVWDLGYVGTAIKDLAGNSAAGYSTQAITNNVAGGGGGTTDPDAQDFIDYAIGKGDTISTTDQDALHQLFIDIKAAGIAMSDIIALYPSAGTTLAHKSRNALAPFDGLTPTTHHMAWSGTGSPTVAADGVTPNGTDQKADTGVQPSTAFAANNAYIGYFSLDSAQGAAASERFDIGAKDTSTAWIALACRHATNTAYGVGASASSGLLSAAMSDGAGYFSVGIDPTGPTNFLAKDGTVIDTDTAAGSFPLAGISIAFASGSGEYSARKFGPVIIAKNITTTKDAALSTAFHDYMTARGF